jgi:hypothetical protein
MIVTTSPYGRNSTRRRPAVADGIVTVLREYECNCSPPGGEVMCVPCRAAAEIERLNELVIRLNDDLSYYRTVISDWVDADNAREGHTAGCYEYGACGVEMCAQENHLRLAVMR